MIGRQARIFLVVGVATVLIDYAIYSLLVFLGGGVALSKGVGFCSGTIFSYFANKRWTFGGSASGGKSFIVFGILYLTTLLVNIVVNQLVLGLVGTSQNGMLIAFVVATGVSAVLNFLGMKFLVFRSPRN